MKTIPKFMMARKESRSIRGEDIFYQGSTPSGISITPDSALSLAPAFACINVLATDLACLPAKLYLKRKSGGRDEVTDDPRSELMSVSPDGERTSMRDKQAQYGHMFGWGNGYSEIVRTGSGRVDSIHLIDPATTIASREAGRIIYEFDSIRGGRDKKLAQDIIHVAGLGYDGLVGYTPPRVLRDAFALGKAAEVFGGTFFGNGSTASGLLKIPGKLSPEAKKNLRDSWEGIHRGPGNSNRVAVLEGGLEFQKLSIDPEDAQFLETRKFQVIEICRIYRVPPHKIMDMSQSHLANIEASNLDYMVTVLMPWCEQIEQEWNLKLLTRSERQAGFYVEHSMTAFMRGDTKTRAEFYDRGLLAGWLSRDEVREKENLNPIGADKGGDKYLVQAQMVPLEMAGVAFSDSATTTTEDAPQSPTGDPVAVPVSDVQGTALNGAQVASLLEIVSGVTTGLIPPIAAKGMILVAFPAFDQATIDTMIDAASAFTSQPDPTNAGGSPL